MAVSIGTTEPKSERGSPAHGLPLPARRQKLYPGAARRAIQAAPYRRSRGNAAAGFAGMALGFAARNPIHSPAPRRRQATKGYGRRPAALRAASKKKPWQCQGFYTRCVLRGFPPRDLVERLAQSCQEFIVNSGHLRHRPVGAGLRVVKIDQSYARWRILHHSPLLD